jgi:hypothetical protein
MHRPGLPDSRILSGSRRQISPGNARNFQELSRHIRSLLPPVTIHVSTQSRCKIRRLHKCIPNYRRGIWVGQTGDPQLSQSEHKGRTIAFPVEYHRKPMQKPIRFQVRRARLERDIPLQDGNDFLLDYLHKSRIYVLMNHEKGLTIHGIDPIVRRGPQAQALPRNKMTGELGLASMVNADMAVHIANLGL